MSFNMGTKECIYLLVLLLLPSVIFTAPCDIPSGRNALILDIVESLGQEHNQTTHPDLLPIEGELNTEIDLELSEQGQRLFTLEGNSLRLNQPLDRDEDNLSTLRFEITCSVRSSLQMRNIPVIVRVEDRNDNVPIFVGEPYSATLEENSPVDSVVFRGINAEDSDAGVNGQVIYEIVSINPPSPSPLPIFDISLPHQGVVFLTAPLDYEVSSEYQLEILVTDLATEVTDRLNATTFLTVHVKDIDDQDPAFQMGNSDFVCQKGSQDCERPEFRSTIVEGKIAGVLNIYPGRIHARDLDSIGASITYSFLSGSPANFREYFEIDSRSAVVRQIKSVDRSQIKKFQIMIQAEEDTPRKGKVTAQLNINVQRVDTFPPRLVMSTYSGMVKEASRPGTPVLREDGTPFVLSVVDEDFKPGEQMPEYKFELTTSAFEVTPEGVLVVLSANLNRDPPSPPMHTFQAIAREDMEGGAASAPVTLRITLIDINDNAPRLPVYPAVTVSAGSERKSILKVKAIDADEGENAVVTYSLQESYEKFVIDKHSGQIFSAGELSAGDQYQLSITATDTGGLTGDGIVDVIVSKAPNTNGPVFQRPVYAATVSEGIAFGGRVLTVKAKDPEGDAPYYSIAAEGNEIPFEIDTLSGVITVITPLDREKKDHYQLRIQAEDSEGKSNFADLTIRILDVNDEAPEFIGLPYSFRVDEGLKNGFVGEVKAEDKDLAMAGKVSYLIEDEKIPFKIETKSGKIFTKAALDYETQKVHYLPVIAHDMGEDPLSSTATVTILVNDLSDEAPLFKKEVYRVSMPENNSIGSLVTTVKAHDPDSVPMVTYYLVDGDATMFKVAPDTGRVTLTSQLDFEKKQMHTLVIGTEENKNNDHLARTKIEIEVEDVNDEAPTLMPFETITIPRTASIGSLVVNVSAFDADGSSPNNKITFVISGDEAQEYFSIDSEKGEIRLHKSLNDVTSSEMKAKVTARDGGQPSHSVSDEFQILLLDGVGEFQLQGSITDLSAPSNILGHQTSLASAPRFSKEYYEILVNEDIPLDSVVLKIPLINTTSAIDCSIISGNENEIFETFTQEFNCEVKIAKSLDYEVQTYYNLTLALHPLGIFPSKESFPANQQALILSRTSVLVNVADINDNPPIFLLKKFSLIPKGLQNNSILTFAFQDSKVDTKVITIQAKDYDAGGKGEINYELLPGSNRGNYFSVNSKTGRISTKRSLKDVPMELKPFNLSLVASDQPGIHGTQHSSLLHIIIPVIEEDHKSVLVLDAPRKEVEGKIDDVMATISSFSGKNAQLESLVRSRRASNGKASSQPLTQVWFHLLEPKSWKPLHSDYILEEKVSTQLVEDISSSPSLKLKALTLVAPQEVKKDKGMIIEEKDEAADSHPLEEYGSILRISTLESLGAGEYVLLILACFIIFFILCAIISVCILWVRFSKKWNDADKTLMLIPPMIEGANSVIDVGKEYEVQVLHMSVPLDDDSVGEVPLESDSPQQFLDNVSYISKAHTNQDGSSSDGAAAGSSGQGTPKVFGKSSWPSGSPEPSFGDFGNEGPSGEPGGLSASASNDNVMFGRRGFLDPSPVETTTEL